VKEQSKKKAYTAPRLTMWGAVADLTKTGQTMPGQDDKLGSSISTGR